VPGYSTTTPATDEVTSGCIITNNTAKVEPWWELSATPLFFADRTAKRRAEITSALPAAKTTVPAHGHIEAAYAEHRVFD